MDTNTLNKHLESKSLGDITRMVDEILGILGKYDEEYNISKHKDYLFKYEYDTSKGEQVFERGISENGLGRIVRDLLKDRYFRSIMKQKTENLLSKIELLD